MKRATSYIVLIFAMVMLTQACASSQPTLSFEPGARMGRTEQAKIDASAIVTEDGVELFNTLGKTMQQV